MKKRTSALIISNNFITSITLNNMLRKLQFEQIFECGLSENAIKIINENNINLVFLDDSKIDFDLNHTIQVLKTCTQAEIILLGLEDDIPSFKEENIYKNEPLSFLSKPLIMNDLKQIIFKILDIKHAEVLV